MSKNTNEAENRVTLFLQDLSLTNSARYELVQTIRKKILNVNKSNDVGIKEEMKYGGILFAEEEAFCGIFVYANHISLEFGEGANLPDQFGVLEGKGKFRRHIKLVTIADIESKHLMHYVKLAHQYSLST